MDWQLLVAVHCIARCLALPCCSLQLAVAPNSLRPTRAQGSAAMALKVIKPTWQQIGSGLAIEREGTVLLEFAKSTGPRSYAWDQKEVRGQRPG